MEQIILEYFSVTNLEDAFFLGICFVVWVELFMTFTDFLYGILRWLHQKRVLHFCQLRYYSWECFADDQVLNVCHERRCPHRSCCRFYRPRPSLWIRLRNWAQKKKP